MKHPAHRRRAGLIAAALIGITTATANDTAVNSAAAGPGPLGEINGQESVIRMVSEVIDITFGRKQSKVRCRFVFRSTKTSGDAVQIVGFPDIVDEEGDRGRILDMVTKVDGRVVAANKEPGWMPGTGAGQARLGTPPADAAATRLILHTMKVVFPPDREVVVEREYTVDNGGSVMGDATFDYTTATGAVWSGTIGRAEFNLTLDGWTVDDLAFEDGPQKIAPRTQHRFSAPNRSDWKILSPTRLQLVWENFEPAVHTTRRGIALVTWVRQARR